MEHDNTTGVAKWAYAKERRDGKVRHNVPH